MAAVAQTDNAFHGEFIYGRSFYPALNQKFGTTYHVRIEGIDSRISVFVNGEELFAFDHAKAQ